MCSKVPLQTDLFTLPAGKNLSQNYLFDEISNIKIFKNCLINQALIVFEFLPALYLSFRVL